ncbi:mucin-1-like [Trachinotus anak]|uniref:mucin-1-like n=1 Tax=Trachinotus anak TaxID=443729 RepID=UPI0039F2049D
MMSAQFFLGASLFALLAVDVCCLPFKGSKLRDSYGSSKAYSAPAFGSNRGAPSSHFSPGAMPNSAPADGASTPSYQPVPQPEPSFSQPARRRPAAPVSSSSSPRPVELGHSGSAGAPFQPAPRDINWAVAPPSIFSGEEMPHGTNVDSSSAAYVSPPLPPPGPMYQAGELSHFEESYEHGDFQRETEEQGFLPPPPPPPFPVHESSGESYTSPPRPVPGPGGRWGFYPYYDYMFLTGQYPPGTVTHASSSFEQGADHWQDAHYVRDYFPQTPGPVEPEAFSGDLAAPQRFQEPQPPVKTGYGQGGSAAGSSRGQSVQPAQTEAVAYNRYWVG